MPQSQSASSVSSVEKSSIDKSDKTQAVASIGTDTTPLTLERALSKTQTRTQTPIKSSEPSLASASSTKDSTDGGIKETPGSGPAACGSVWTAKKEFAKIKSPIVVVNKETIAYLKKWINITLLRDDSFFAKLLTQDELAEFTKKVNDYCLKNGSENENSSLYFAIYGFSPSLEDKLLSLRNIMAMYITSMMIYPTEAFSSSFNVTNNGGGSFKIDALCKGIKLIDGNASLGFRKILQEVTLDLGCSSYALGKINHFINNLLVYEEKDSGTTITVSAKNVSPISGEMFSEINMIAMALYSNPMLHNEIIFTENEKSLVALIDNNLKTFVPVNFPISNKILLHYIRAKIEQLS